MMEESDSHDQPNGHEFLSVDTPGKLVEVPQHIVKQLEKLLYDGKKKLSFFGGHPVSITKRTCNQIYSNLNNITRQSPFLVCEKTDGVRYLLIVAKVKASQLVREMEPGEEAPHTEFYLVSRQGYGKLTAYAADIAISHLFQAASTETQGAKRSVIEVLDGQLIKQKGGQIRYLIFDALIHLGRNICPMPLRDRLECATNFMRCNEMLGVRPSLIEVRIKDFFRLSCPKFNMTDFMIRKYTKCLPHQNDGLIFNHEEKHYVLGGTNEGYIKWKPAHLNTVDFMLVPNLNLEETVGRRVLDLYLATRSQELDRYTRQFYTFAVVSQADFSKLLHTYEENQMKVANEEIEKGGETFNINEFGGAIIAECRYETTKGDQRSILAQLYRMSEQQLCRSIMKQGDDNADKKAVKAVVNTVYDKCWKIYKIRGDKSLPNNTEVAKKIEQSIRDGISEQMLLTGNDKLIEKVIRM